ncbi:MAG: AraC family transcriptional regulator [Chthoniobacteraceae bacterium]
MKSISDFPLRLNTLPTIYHCERGWHWSPPPLRDYDFWYVLDGTGELSLAKETIPLKAGVCLVFRPGDQPRATQDPARRLVVFAAHFDLGKNVPKPARLHRVRDTPFLNALAHHCAATARRGETLGAEQSLLHLRQMLLLLLQESSEPPPSPIDLAMRGIITAIEREPGRRWSVDALARQAHLSRSQFTRRFTSITGLPPNRFLVIARMARARQLIEETTMTLSQIADALHYRDIYFFSRQFKQFTGTPPGDLRKN